MKLLIPSKYIKTISTITIALGTIIGVMIIHHIANRNTIRTQLVVDYAFTSSSNIVKIMIDRETFNLRNIASYQKTSENVLESICIVNGCGGLVYNIPSDSVIESYKFMSEEKIDVSNYKEMSHKILSSLDNKNFIDTTIYNKRDYRDKILAWKIGEDIYAFVFDDEKMREAVVSSNDEMLIFTFIIIIIILCLWITLLTLLIYSNIDKCSIKII